MRLVLLTLATLLMLPLLPVASAEVGAPPRCVLVAQDLDYSHWLCVDASDPTCAVYTETRGGYPSVVKRCYGVFEPGWIGIDADATCIPTSGGLDYPSWLCVDPSDLRCPVYTITTSDWGVKKTCVPPR